MVRHTLKKIKVLFISHEDPGIGGAPKSLIELIKNLKNQYNIIPVVLVYSKDKVYKFCQSEGIECYITRHRNSALGIKSSFLDIIKAPVKGGRQLIDDIRAVNYLNKVVDFSTIDLIHTNVSVVSLGIALHKKYGIPHIVHLRESPVIIKNDIFSHINYINYLNKGTTKFIAISEYTKKGWIKKGLLPEKVDRIYNGLVLPSKSTHTILKNKSIKVALVGSLQNEKGQKIVIEAFSKLPKSIQKQFTLDIIGTGNINYINKLKEAIYKNNLNNINFLGYRENVSDLLKKYDIGIMSSYSEAFGRTTVEYMAAGLGVIGARGGATPELIGKHNGYLYTANDSDDLTNLLIKIYKNPKLMINKAKEAQDSAYKLFTSNINSKNVYNEYLKVLNIH